MKHNEMSWRTAMDARILAATLLLLFSAVPTWAQRELPTRHVREQTLNGQAPIVGVLPGTLRLNLAIMLPLRNQAELDDLLEQLYDPQNPSYGQYLTVEEFTESFGPTQDEYDAVVAFAKANNMAVTETFPNRMVIGLSASVSDIQKAFHLTLGVYQHPTEKRTFYAPDREPSVDVNIHLWHIAGLDNFSIPQPASGPGVTAGGGAGTGSGPGGSFIGSDMRAAYYGGTSLTGSGQVLGLVEFSAYNLSDVQTYFRNVGQTLNVPINNVLLAGFNGVCGSCNDSEAALDIQQAISMAPGLSQVNVYEVNPTSIGNGGDVTILNRMASDKSTFPQLNQLSCSWVWEPDDPSSDEPIFEEFSAQGQSFLAASGDWGAYPNSTPYYYPPEDPYVTAVGGTDLTTTGPGGAWRSETAWIDSGGGISPDHLAISSYQQLSGVINSSNKGSTTYRNVPDIAAQADYLNYICYSGSCATNWGGTSFSAPRWAGFVALVNQSKKANGKAVMGFLNPTIYPIGLGSSYSNYLHDISSGNNDCCSQSLWYNAVTGYDLVTGWGSPIALGWLGGGIVLPAPGIIKTVAGDGTRSYSGDGGSATSAALDDPLSVAVDSVGNIYIADSVNARIRKVTAATGIITTVAGNGTHGYSGDGGPATNAELDFPTGVAVDSAGNIYIADYDNYRIRKVVASTGVISTMAGTGTYGYSGDGGPATSAELGAPTGVALDTAGNLYIADCFNERIRKVAKTTGIISTVAGDGTIGYSGDGGPATSAEFYYPWGVAVDSAGNIYIADTDNGRNRKVTVSTDIISTVAGDGEYGSSGDGGLATSAELSSPYGVPVDNWATSISRIRAGNASAKLRSPLASFQPSPETGGWATLVMADQRLALSYIFPTE